MYKHNDYVKLTREYLRNYPYYKQAVKSITEDIAEIREQLAVESPKTAKYGADTGGDYSELNSTEQAAHKRMRLEYRQAELQDNCRALRLQMYKVEDAVNRLPDEDIEIVKLFYFDRLPHQDLARRLCLSERSSKRRVKKATETIAFMLFGLDAKKPLFFIRDI